MQGASLPRNFSARPDHPLCASPSALSTTGPTGAAAILDSEKGQFYSLNDVGARVWSLLSDGTTFGAIVEQLQSEYNVAAETLTVDVERLLQQFAGVGLLRMGGGAHDER